MIAARLRAWRRRVRFEWPREVRDANENTMETPTMKTKKGNTKSVGVQPFHFACSSGQYTCSPSPPLFTRIITAIVMPRKTSRHSSGVLPRADQSVEDRCGRDSGRVVVIAGHCRCGDD